MKLLRQTSAKDRVSTRLKLSDYLSAIGVRSLPACISPFDPGYDPATLESHLAQSGHLMSSLKISMACWLIADEGCSRRKIAAARECAVPTVTGGGPFEIAQEQGQLDYYFDLCADFGVSRVECGEGFTELRYTPTEIVRKARERNLEVQFELGKKHTGSFGGNEVQRLIAQGEEWLNAGACQLVVEARESAVGVGLFDEHGTFNGAAADEFAQRFGLHLVMFEAPNKASQFAFLDHFGTDVHLCNVRLEEVLRVEIYRRGLHSDAFGKLNLRPTPTGPAERSNGKNLRN